MIENALPDQPTSIYALDGIFAHAVCDYALKKAIPPKRLEKRLLNRKLDFDVRNGSEIKQMTRAITKDILENISVYINYIYKKTKFEGVLAENQLSIHKGKSVIVTGTCDSLFIKNKTLYVIDYKHGQGVDVSITDNPQLLLYAIGAFKLFEKDVSIKKVKIVVIQPRTTGIKEQTFSIAELKGIIKDFESVYKKIETDPQLVTGEHCRWCKAEHNCIAKLFEYKEIEDPEIRKNLITASDFVNVLNNMDSIRGFLSAVEKEAYHILDKGGSVPGFKLVRKREMSKYALEERIIIKRLKKKGYKAKDICKPKQLLPIGQLKKVVPETVVNKYITKESSGMTLAKESDNRPSISNAEIEFKE